MVVCFGYSRQLSTSTREQVKIRNNPLVDFNQNGSFCLNKIPASLDYFSLKAT